MWDHAGACLDMSREAVGISSPSSPHKIRPAGNDHPFPHKFDPAGKPRFSHIREEFRPAGNTDPPRIRSTAYDSTRLIELMMNLWFAAWGERSFPLKKTENSQKSPGITLEKCTKMTKFRTRLKRPILVSIDSS